MRPVSTCCYSISQMQTTVTCMPDELINTIGPSWQLPIKPLIKVSRESCST